MNLPFITAMLCLVIVLLTSAQGAVLTADPDTYKKQVDRLQPGDTLFLASGIYDRGLNLRGIHGSADALITITGPENGNPAVFLGDRAAKRNTIQLEDSSYLIIRNLELDGLRVPYIDGVNARGVTHHITLEGLRIVNHGGGYKPDTAHQLTVGISTKGAAWNWVIRGNEIIGAGTGMYLGNSDGSAPFFAGIIENNLIVDTLGYNLQIKHQNDRPGLLEAPRKTIIRHNVFSKAHRASIGGKWARPSLLVGHFPLKGSGSTDVYEIYGNFFYQNPADALFQGEGNIAFYDNVLINDAGLGINIRPHKDIPKTIYVFHNTVLTRGSGIRVTGAGKDYAQQVFSNTVFSDGQAIRAVSSKGNITGRYLEAADYLRSPFARFGALDLRPLVALRTQSSPVLTLLPFSDSNKDFNGNLRSGRYPGAFTGNNDISNWPLQLSIKPSTPVTAATEK